MGARPVATMLTRLLQPLTLFLAQPVKPPADRSDPLSLRDWLLPGDVLLTDGITRGAALVRRITRSPWAHVSMYVGPLGEGPDAHCIVEADVAAGVRSVPLSELAGQQLRVLRPRGLEHADRRRLADWVVGRIGDAYDFAHAWRLAIALRLPFLARLASAGGAMAQNSTRFICSTLVAHAFLLVGYTIPALQLAALAADAEGHRYVTPQDFELAPAFEVLSLDVR